MKKSQFLLNQQIFILTLYFQLSLMLAKNNNSGPPPSNNSNSGTRNSHKKKRNILIVDDERRFSKAMRFHLEEMYIVNVRTAASGYEAISHLKEYKKYDLIFLDIMMNGMDGIETYYHLKKMGINCQIVMMSAFADSKQWERAEELNIPLLHKPFKGEDLDKIINDLPGGDNGKKNTNH